MTISTDQQTEDILIKELSPALSPREVFSKLAALPYCLFLESAMRHPTLGRYSFVMADPREVHLGPGLPALTRSGPTRQASNQGLPRFWEVGRGCLGMNSRISWKTCHERKAMSLVAARGDCLLRRRVCLRSRHGPSVAYRPCTS